MKRNNERDAIIKTAIGFVIGAAIGTGVGILVAPRKGSKTRRRMRHGMADARHDVSDWLTDAKDDISKAAHDKKKEFEKRMG